MMQESLARPHLANIAPYISGRPAGGLDGELGVADLVRLASNESAYGPSPAALEAVRRAVADVHRYPDPDGFELRVRLARLHGVDPEEVALGNGSGELVDSLVRTLAGPEHHGVVGVPSFPAYALLLAVNSVPTTRVPLRQGLYWDADALLSAVQPQTRLLFVDNPNNPTGTHLAREGLSTLLRGLPDHVVPVIDEAYVQYASADDYVTALELRQLNPRLVVLRTFSKAFGLAALRVGYAIAPRALLREVEKVRAPFHVNGLALTGALAALDDPEHVERAVSSNASERARVAAELVELGFAVAPSQANFLYLELPADSAMDSAALCAALGARGVVVRGMPSPRHLRATLGLPAENDRLIETLCTLR